jgi:adenine-specific DNA-methyltransferase
MLEDNRVWFGASGGNIPALKQFLSEVQEGAIPTTLWLREEVGDNQEAVRELSNLDIPFDSPKPVRLIKRALQISSSNTEDIILDFFAGSAVTAHAALEQNNEDGGNRRFIMVQLPEPTENPEYPTIADIGKERIRRVANKLNTEDGEQLSAQDDPGQDRGFRVFKLTSSNFKVWDSSEESAADEDKLQSQLEDFVSNVNPGRTQEQILYEILLERGLTLDSPIETVSIADKEAFSVPGGGPDDRELLVCLADSVDDKMREEIETREPWAVVFLDAAFDGNDELKTNMRLGLEERGIKFSTF